MSKRTIFLLALGAIAALVVGWQVSAYAGSVLTNSGFEADDGNLDDGSANGIDWNTFHPISWVQSDNPPTPSREADKVQSGFTFKGIEDWQATTADSGFAGGTKQDDSCAKVISAKAPNKDDLKRVYMATNNVGGNVYLDLAWVRIPQNTTSPSAHIGFEFNKGSTPCGAGSGGLVQRSAGDMLIVYDFEGGATETPTITLRRWVTSGTCEISSNSAPCWGTATNLTALNFAEARVNTTGTVRDQLAPPSSLATANSVGPPGALLGLNEFGEAGINLTAAGVFPVNGCASFGNAYAVSRSSGNSGTAQMKDLVGPADFNLSNCGTVNIIKQTSPAGLDEDFEFTSANSPLAGTCTIGPTSETTPASFTLNDGSADTDSLTCTDVPAGNYTVTEGDPTGTGFTFTDLSCTASGTGTSATPTGPQSATRTASITMAGSGTVTCTYTNTQNKQSTLNTEQGFIPNDTARITGTGITGDGSVDFKLRQGTLSDPADCGTADDTNPVVYSETVDVTGATAPFTASTNNSGDPDVNGGYTILDGASEGPYYWEVTYTGVNDPDVTSCNEVSTVTINNGSGVSEPPTL